MATEYKQHGELSKISFYKVSYVGPEGIEVTTNFAAKCAKDIISFWEKNYDLAYEITSIRNVGTADLIKTVVE